MRIMVPELQPNVRYECLVCGDPVPHACRMDGVPAVPTTAVAGEPPTLMETLRAVSAAVMIRQARFQDGAIRLHLQHHTTQSEG